MISIADLARLGEIARRDRRIMFQRNPRWNEYKDRVLCVALCQGGALHFLDARTGLKDFDVWTFFARSPHRPHPDPSLFRRNKPADFGVSRFGRSPDAPKWIQGRRVDLLARSLDVDPDADAIDAVRRWLEAGRTHTARMLAEKAIVMIDPDVGRIVWPDDSARS